MKRHIDAKLLLFVIFLITFGLVMVLSSSAIGEVSGTQFKYFYRQLIAVFLGGILCAGAALTPTDTLKKPFAILCCCCIWIVFVLCTRIGVNRQRGFSMVWVWSF